MAAIAIYYRQISPYLLILRKKTGVKWKSDEYGHTEACSSYSASEVGAHLCRTIAGLSEPGGWRFDSFRPRHAFLDYNSL